jgi:uncharacterized phage infection (PIP) family protein YhgE
MNQTLNEELNKIKNMMGIEEQKFFDKLKTAAQNVGDKIQTGVNQVAQKVANVTQTQQPIQQISPILKEYNDFVSKWKLVNDDPKSNKVFIERNDEGRGDSYNFEMLAKMDAYTIYGKRLLDLNPMDKIMRNNFRLVNEPLKNCYMKPDGKGNTVTYCAFVFEIEKK